MCISTTEALHTVKTLINDDVYECCEASMDKEKVSDKLEKIKKYINKIDKKEKYNIEVRLGKFTILEMKFCACAEQECSRFRMIVLNLGFEI